MHTKNWSRAAVTSAVLMAASACSDVTPTASHAALHVMTPSTQMASLPSDLLRSVHAATSRFNATQQATRAGYVSNPHCVSVPSLGGMGHHWANNSLVDPTFDPFQPEVMLYAPNKEGKMKLVAVEYIVIDVGQPRPSFGGQPFDIGGTPVPVPHWSLHVWVHEENPSGTFAPFNPRVSCGS